MNKVLKRISCLLFLFVAFFAFNSVSAASSIGPITAVDDLINGSCNWRNGSSCFPFKSYGSGSSKKAVFCTLYKKTTPTGLTCTKSNDWSEAIKVGVGQIIQMANEDNSNLNSAMSNEYYFAQIAIGLFLYNKTGQTGGYLNDNWPCDNNTNANCATAKYTDLLKLTSGTSYKRYYDKAKEFFDKVDDGTKVDLTLKSGKSTWTNVNTETTSQVENTYTLSGTNVDKYVLNITSTDSNVKVKINDDSNYYTLGSNKTVSAGDLKITASNFTDDFTLKIKVNGSFVCYKATKYSCGKGYQTLTPNEVEKNDCGEGYDSVKMKVSTLDQPEYPKIKVRKVDSKDGHVLSGARIKFVKKTDNETTTGTTGSDGTIEKDIIDEAAKYCVTEIEAPSGYFLDNTEHCFDITVSSANVVSVSSTDPKVSYNNSNPENFVLITLPNEKNYVELAKVDKNGNLISNAGMVLYKTNSDGTLDDIVDVWVSSSDGYHRIDGLPNGNYALYEENAPRGYKKVTSSPVTFKVSGKYTKANVISKTFQNDEISLNISKRKITGTDELAGAELRVCEQTDTSDECTPVITTCSDSSSNVPLKWTSGTEQKVFSCVPAGKYRLVETTAPDGYIRRESIDFEIDDYGVIKQNSTKQTVIVMTNEQNKLEIKKIDSDTQQVVVGAVLKITDKNGKTVKLNNKDLEWTTEKNAKVITGLPKGTYYVEEVSAPEGYVKSDVKTEFKVNANGKISQGNTEKESLTIMMTNSKTKVYLSKQDITTKEELEGAKLRLYDGRNVLIEEWTSGKEPHYIEGLATNQTYTLEEVTAPEGYDKAESITFTINSDGTITGDTVMYDKLSTVKVEDTLLNRSILVIVFGAILVISGIVISRKNELKKMTK